MYIEIKKINNHYDIIFSGWGASTCILLKQMNKNNLLENKSILIVEPEYKFENDKTFCFWAEESDQIYIDYKSIISNKWEEIQINDFKKQSISPLKYFHISSSDLYKSTRDIIKKNNIIVLNEKVKKVNVENNILKVNVNNQNISCDWLFNCIPFFKNKNDEFNISQSFIGFKVRLKENSFSSEVYRMMDFRVSQNNATQFIYILPYNDNEALVELTRFGKLKIDENESEIELNQFINTHFGDFELIEKERGVIPMDSSIVQQNKIKNWVNIGTSGGSVKPSTGYAFKNMYDHAVKICKNGSLNNFRFKRKSRFLFYDQLLLIILTLWPNRGKPIFEKLFQTRSSYFVLNFLDEKTTFKDEIRMFLNLPIGIFLKAVFVWIYSRFKHLLFPFFMILYVIIFQDNHSIYNSVLLNDFEVFILGFGLLTIGIPHGALDHLTETILPSNTISIKFIFIYLILMVPIFLLWLWYPLLGLIFFLIYSCWHFGQTDFKNWKIENNLLSFLWAVSLLFYMFLTHYNEFNDILKLLNISSMPIIKYPNIIALILVLPFLFYSVYLRKWNWLFCIIFVLLSALVNLTMAFGLYFIFHHSRMGWLNLKQKLKISHFKMFWKALPFNVGALLLFWIFFVEMNNSISENIAYFFMFLSCISFPHIICMTMFYNKKFK